MLHDSELHVYEFTIDIDVESPQSTNMPTNMPRNTRRERL